VEAAEVAVGVMEAAGVVGADAVAAAGKTSNAFRTTLHSPRWHGRRDFFCMRG
jgi:hypothetical protein